MIVDEALSEVLNKMRDGYHNNVITSEEGIEIVKTLIRAYPQGVSDILFWYIVMDKDFKVEGI
jgi:hypothetical protein